MVLPPTWMIAGWKGRGCSVERIKGRVMVRCAVRLLIDLSMHARYLRYSHASAKRVVCPQGGISSGNPVYFQVCTKDGYANDSKNRCSGQIFLGPAKFPIQFRSVQDGIYALGEAHMRSTPSLTSFDQCCLRSHHV